MATLAKLIVQLGLQDGLSSGLKGVSENVTKFGRNMTTFVTIPMLAAGTAAVKWGSDLNESMSAANTVFGSSGSAIIKWGDTTAKTLGIAKSDALTAATQFASLGKTAGLTNDELVPFSTSLVTAASDLSSFWNVPTSTVLQDLQSGLVGQYEPLLKYGIQLNEATVNQRALIQTGKDNVDQLTIGEKTMARYTLILEGLGAAEGDRARTSGEFAGQMRTLQAQFKDSAAVLGMQLLPMLTQLVDNLNQLIVSYNGLSPKQQKIIEGFAVIALVIGPLALAIGFVAAHVTALASAIGTVIAPLTAMSALLFIWRPIIAPISNAMKMLGISVSEVGDTLKSVSATIRSFVSSASSQFQSLQTKTTTIFTTIQTTVTTTVSVLKDNVLGYIGDLALGASAWLDVIETYFSDAWDNVAETAGTKVGEMYANVLALINSLASSVYSSAFNIGYQVGNGIISGISSIWDSVVGYAGSLADAVLDRLKGPLGFILGSPSKATAYMGEMLGEGLIQGMARSERSVAAAAGGMSGAAYAGMSGTTINGGMTIQVSGAGDPNAVADRVFSRFVREMALTTGGV